MSHLALPILYHLSQGSLVRTLPHRALTGRRPGYSSPTCPSSGMFLHLKSFFSLESISLEPEHLSKRGSVFVFSFQTVILHFLSSFEAPHASLASFTIYHQNTDLRDISQGITEILTFLKENSSKVTTELIY